MVSDESDDEPLSNLAAKKKSGEYEYEPPSSSDEEPKKTKKKKELPAKKLGVTIKLNRKLNSLIGPAVIERPSDVWLYLKDLNPTGPYSCLLCTDWFINRSKMILHYALNHKKDFCGICRYNSGSKCFSQVHTKHLTVTIDAFMIHNSLWQGKKVQLPSKKDMALVI